MAVIAEKSDEEYKKIASEYAYKCDFCNREYKQERFFLNHSCIEKRKYLLLKEQIGKAAWGIYKEWIYKKTHMRLDNVSSFYNSSFFFSFINFAKFSKRIGIKHLGVYLDIMVSKNFNPKWWCRDDIYLLYLEEMDRKTSCKKQLEISFLTMQRCMDIFKVPMNEVFNTIDPYNIIELIRKRQLLPWFLLNYKPFFTFFSSDRLTEGERNRLEKIIRSDYWQTEFAKNKAKRKKVQEQIKKFEKSLENQ